MDRAAEEAAIAAYEQTNGVKVFRKRGRPKGTPNSGPRPNDQGRQAVAMKGPTYGQASLEMIAWSLETHAKYQRSSGSNVVLASEDWEQLSEVVKLADALGDALEWALPWLESCAKSGAGHAFSAKLRDVQGAVREYQEAAKGEAPPGEPL